MYTSKVLFADTEYEHKMSIPFKVQTIYLTINNSECCDKFFIITVQSNNAIWDRSMHTKYEQHGKFTDSRTWKMKFTVNLCAHKMCCHSETNKDIA